MDLVGVIVILLGLLVLVVSVLGILEVNLLLFVVALSRVIKSLSELLFLGIVGTDMIL